MDDKSHPAVGVTYAMLIILLGLLVVYCLWGCADPCIVSAMTVDGGNNTRAQCEASQ